MENNKKQIVFIHGGDAFRDTEKLYEMLRSRSNNPFEEKKFWRDSLIESLSDTFDCAAIKMPNPNWADYEAWKIWFEKAVPYFKDGIIIVGNSLGGGFLLRYLSENELPVTIAQAHFTAPVVLDDIEDCEGFSIDMSTWKGFKNTIGQVHLWHSSDDPYVPIAHSEAVLDAYPEATLHRFTDRGHFFMKEFPELLEVIKNTTP